MAKKFLSVEQALDYFEQLESDDFSDDPEIVILPSEPSIVTDEEDIEENNLCNDLLQDVSGEVEISVNFKSTENDENCNVHLKRKKKLTKRKQAIIDKSSDESYETENETKNRKKRKTLKKSFVKHAVKRKKSNKEIFDWSECSDIIGRAHV